VETTTTAETERKPDVTAPASAANTVVRLAAIVAKAYEAAAEHCCALDEGRGDTVQREPRRGAGGLGAE